MIVQNPGTMTPFAMPSVTPIPVTPMEMTHDLPFTAAPPTIRPDEFIPSPFIRLGIFLITMTTPLIFATGCDFFKKTKQDEPQAVSSTSDTGAKGAIPREAYVIGTSKTVSIPKGKHLSDGRAAQLKKEAEKKAYASLDLMLRRMIVSKMGGCVKGKIHPTIIKTEHKKIEQVAPDNTLRIYYEFWILWKEALCKTKTSVGGYRVRVDTFSIGNPDLPR